MTSINTSDTVYYFTVNVPYQQCEALYSPSISSVLMTCESGLTIQVPTSRLRQFVTSVGVKGRFRMITDAHHKIKSFERLR